MSEELLTAAERHARILVASALVAQFNATIELHCAGHKGGVPAEILASWRRAKPTVEACIAEALEHLGE